MDTSSSSDTARIIPNESTRLVRKFRTLPRSGSGSTSQARLSVVCN
jgi:hypothetical protein